MPQVFETQRVWNDIFATLSAGNRTLGCSLFLSRRPIDELFPSITQSYTADGRREWNQVLLHETDKKNAYVLSFAARTREPVLFFLEQRSAGRELYSYRAFSVAEGALRRSTIESFISVSLGVWAPRLSFSSMDDLTPRLNDLFPDGSISMDEFVVTVFERRPHARDEVFLREKTVRAWVEREGDREFDLFREMNLQRGRVVTLTGAKYTIQRPREIPIVLRCDHTCRMVLSSPAVDGFLTFVNFIEEQAVQQYKRYRVRQRLARRQVRTDAGGEANMTEYGGTDTITITVRDEAGDGAWFVALRDTFQDEDFLADSERMMSFVLVDERNPIVQFQLVDLESQSTINLTANKATRQIVLAPQEETTKESSVAKVLNLLEKATGSPLILS